MVVSCSVWGCTARFKKKSGLSFHRFPTSSEQKHAWITKINRVKCVSKRTKADHDYSAPSTPLAKVQKLNHGGSVGSVKSQWTPGVWDCVCGKHFIAGKPNADPSHPDYAPSLYMRPEDFCSSPNSTCKKNTSKMLRYERKMRRKELFQSSCPSRSGEATVSCEDTDEQPDVIFGVGPHLTGGTTGDAQEIIVGLQQENIKLRDTNIKMSNEIDALRKERDYLKDRLERSSFSHENLTDKKNKFYTGLPSPAVFLWVFSLVAAFITERRVLTKENQLLVTLIKLRLALQNVDRASRFGVSVSTVSDVISECISILAERLNFLIQWPSRDILMKNMPDIFKKRFDKCCVIIDCTEFFIERPYNLRTLAKTWSNYKHHHTLKGLIGITPYGSISFVSKLWGGRISDKEITQKSGFYEKIMYGDQVMGDRGFTIVNELARLGATLVIPPFIKGRKQLPGVVVQRARQLSALRIHVERAMERIKNFKILKHTLPLTLVGHSSDILTVCGALTNLSPRLIK